MGFRVTPEMRQKVGDTAVAELFEYARRVGCQVMNDNIVCTARQLKLIKANWKEKLDARGKG